jgi:hypothetical protein
MITELLDASVPRELGELKRVRPARRLQGPAAVSQGEASADVDVGVFREAQASPLAKREILPRIGLHCCPAGPELPVHSTCAIWLLPGLYPKGREAVRSGSRATTRKLCGGGRVD